MRHNGQKLVWISDGCIISSVSSNTVKRAVKKTNHAWGTKSKFSGPFTEEELRRFNSINSTGKW